jgi:tRNA(Ile)-lysidine synthase
LAGIPVRRELAGKLTLIRPLHNVWRSQIEHYCSSHNLKPVTDRSNLSTHYIRNRIRLRLLPFMEAQFGRHVRGSLAKASDLLARDSSLLAELTERAFRKNVIYNGNDCILSLSALHRLPDALQARLLRRMMWAAGVERLSVTHVRAVQALAMACSPSAQISLPGGITAARVYNDIHIGKQAVSKPVPDGISSLLVPGRTVLPWGGQSIEASIVDAAGLKFPLKNRLEACLDLDCLVLPLIVRTRRPGDRVRLLGAAGGRKVKDILIDKKIPAKERDYIPLVESGGRIAWIGGVEIAHSFRVTPATKRVLYLKLNQTTG